MSKKASNHMPPNAKRPPPPPSPPALTSSINTHTRLFDLVRYMRGELHQAELITDEEYVWLVQDAPQVQSPGSPSARRLEDYDDLRANLTAATEALRDVAAHFSEGNHVCWLGETSRLLVQKALCKIEGKPAPWQSDATIPPTP